MSRRSHGVLWSLLALATGLTPASAAPAHLIKDLNTTPLHGGTILLDAQGADGVFFFLAAETPGSRTTIGAPIGQLWVSDGTAEGTVLLKEDLSWTQHLLVVGRRAFFAAFDGVHGREPWVSDGTPEGTRMVRDLVPGLGESKPESPVAFGGKFYFTAEGPTGRFLWRTDGTEDGTEVVGVVPGLYGRPAQVGTLGTGLDALFGWFDDGVHGFEPWRTDGTPEGTWMLADIRPGSGSSRSYPSQFVELNGAVLFVANDGTGSALWSSDGTDQGVARLGGVPFGTNLTRIGSLLFYDGGGGPWRTDGTHEGTISLGDLGPQGAAPRGFVGTEEAVYFTAGNGWRGLWRTDGSAAGTVLVHEYWSLEDEPLQALGGRVLFRAVHPELGRELWAMDGSESAVVADVYPGPTSGIEDSPFFRVVGDRLWFQAEDGIHGPEVWLSDGTTAGTTLLADLNPFVGTESSSPSSFTDVSGKPFFTTRAELWRTDGTSDGTNPVAGVNTVGCCLFAGNQLLFFRKHYPDGAIWRSDGSSEGTFPLTSTAPEQLGSFYPLTSLGEKTLIVRSYFDQDELWSSDGTVAGTVHVADGRPSDVGRLGGVGILGFDGPQGRELWRTDATPEGTYMIRDIEEGPASSSPFSFVALGERLFFFVEDGYLHALWVTDGTADGTLLVRSIAGSYPRYLTAAGDLVFFTTGLQDGALWRSDGTESGTLRIQLFDQARIDQLTRVGNRVFFRVEMGSSMIELWTSDGTQDGTVRVLEAAPNSMAAAALFGVHDRLLFSAAVGSPFLPGPRQLWRTDGTEQGTRAILDISPAHFAQVGTRLYFEADDGIHGREPWVARAAILAGQPLAALRDLRAEIETLDAPSELTRGLAAKLDAAVTAFESGDREAARRALRTAIRQLAATTRRRVDRAAAEELLTFAREVLELLDSE